jgi:hypothetical protein
MMCGLFQDLYPGLQHLSGAAVEAPQAVLSNPNAMFKQDASGHQKYQLGRTLPPWLQHAMMVTRDAAVFPTGPGPRYPPRARAHNLDSFWHQIQHDSSAGMHNRCASLLIPCVSRVVAQYSASQAVKGIFTAGTQKSVLYASQKLAKMFKK